MADPMWTMGRDFRPERTERDGLAFILNMDTYHRTTSVTVRRASDDAYLETVNVSNPRGAVKVVHEWCLEEWRARQEHDALDKVAVALTEHRKAMERLNYVRAFKV